MNEEVKRTTFVEVPLLVDDMGSHGNIQIRTVCLQRREVIFARLYLKRREIISLHGLPARLFCAAPIAIELLLPSFHKFWEFEIFGATTEEIFGYSCYRGITAQITLDLIKDSHLSVRNCI